MTKKTLVITGGGTGGHIYPGLAVARSIVERYKDWNVEFVGVQGGLEEKIVPENKFQLHLIKMGRFHSSVGKLRQLITIIQMPFAIISALILIFKLRPQAILGVGGFASFPLLVAGILTRTKTYTWDGNAMPGMVNRNLGPWCDKNFLVFEEAKKYLPQKSQVIGIPVRDDFFKFKNVKPIPPPFKVLIFGGSQGSQAINLAVQDMILKYRDTLIDFQFIHQTGEKNFLSISEIYKKNNADVRCVPYVVDMPRVLNEVNICICRAGASTVAETCATQTPAIFIPLPTAADDHQTQNAKSIVDAGGGFMIPQGQLSAQSLYDVLVRFRNDPSLFSRLGDVLAKFNFKDVDKKIADTIIAEVN